MYNIVEKRWGGYYTLKQGQTYLVKFIWLNPGCPTSLQTRLEAVEIWQGDYLSEHDLERFENVTDNL